MLKRVSAIFKYMFNQFHHNMLLIIVLMFSIFYYSLSVYINSSHEFDNVFSSVLFDNVILSNCNGLIQIAKNSKHYQINTIAILYKINCKIKEKQYIEAINILNQIINQYHDIPVMRDMLLIRKALISILVNDNIDNYIYDLNQDKRYSDKKKEYLISVAKKYYNSIL